jgi:hypothetical protein
MASYDRMINREFSSTSINVSNPKNDAIRYFRAAIQAYQQALALDPSLKNDPGLLVQPRLDESAQFLSRLTQGPPPYRSYYGRVGSEGSSASRVR